MTLCSTGDLKAFWRHARSDVRARSLLRAGAVVLLATVLAGCGVLSTGRGWGQDATLFPGREQISRAAMRAVGDPMVWAPAAGAAIFGLSDLDERVSTWASEHTPIFGSMTRADNASDSLLAVANASYLVTALATPGGHRPGQWVVSKVKGIGLEYAAVRATGASTDALKRMTDRERPDGSDRSSLPSRHSSTGFARATLARRNLEALRLGEGVRTTMQVGVMSAAVGTAWARVEARKHFPSDVLAGAALGNFIASFVHDAFLGLPEDQQFALSVVTSRARVVVVVAVHF